MDALLVIVLFSGYLENLRIWRLLSVALFALSLVTNYGQYKNIIIHNFAFIISGITVIILLSISSIVSESKEYIATNLKGIFYPICLILTYASVIGYDIKRLYYYFRRRLVFINIVYLLNIFVLWRQVNGDSFLIKKSWLLKNPFYPDQCCGLFGYNGTHVLGLFSIFVLLLNISFIRNIKAKAVPIIYTIFCECILLYSAVFSDNMSLWLLTPFFLIIYFFSAISRERGLSKVDMTAFKKFFKKFVIVVGVAAVVFGIVNFTEASDFIDNIVNRVYNTIFFSDNKVGGSNERLAIPILALSHSWGWQFGFGLGSCQFQSSGSFGFSHFGLSSIGSVIFLCGIWTYIAVGTLYSSIAMNFSTKNQKYNGLKFYAVLFLIFVMLTTYTYVLTDIRLALLFMLITSVMRFTNIYDEINNNCTKEYKRDQL